MTSVEASTEHRPAMTGYLLILLAVVFWGGSAALAKFLFIRHYDTLIITQMRSTLSFLLLAAYFAIRDRTVFRIRREDLPLFLIVGVVGIALTNFTYYYTVATATVATAILVQYTAPVLVTLYMVFVAREEQGSRIKSASLVLALIGCYFAVRGEADVIRLPGWSAVTGPASAVFFAMLMIVSKRLLKTYSQWTVLLYAFGLSAVFWQFVNPPWIIVAAEYTPRDWGVFWVFAVVSILIPHTAFTVSLRMLEASTVGIVSTLEPVVAIVAAWLVLGEELSATQVAGGAAILAAVVLLQVNPRSWARFAPGEHA